MLAEHPKLKSAQLKKIKDPRKPLKKGMQENFADSAPNSYVAGLVYRVGQNSAGGDAGCT